MGRPCHRSMSILSWGPHGTNRGEEPHHGRSVDGQAIHDSRVTLCVREYGWQAEALQECPWELLLTKPFGGCELVPSMRCQLILRAQTLCTCACK